MGVSSEASEIGLAGAGRFPGGPNMKRLLAAVAALAVAGAANAEAAVIDFLAAGNAAERGIANVAAGVPNLTLSGVAMRLTSTNTNTGAAYFSYLDAGDAGLGVCKVIDSANQCAPSSDDNVTTTESVMIQFLAGPLNIDKINLRLEGHTVPASAAELAKTLLIAINGGSFTRYTFGQALAATFTNVSSIRFAFDDASANTTADQFYLSSLVVTPVPAALPLLLSGLAGLGFAARRKRTRAAV